MKAKTQIEDSISLRFISSAMAIVGILAACQLADTPPGLILFGIFGTAMGSCVSYWRRRSNNFWIKWCLAAGILLVLGGFVEALLYRIQASIADAREPLSNMLIALQALHSFDLPRRRDLNISALVGLTLLASVSLLSRDIIFGVYLAAYFCFAAYMLYLDCTSRTLENAADPQSELPVSKGRRQFSSPTFVLVTLLPLAVLATFFCLPRLDLDLLNNIQVSLKMQIPAEMTARIRNPMLTHARRRDGSLVVDPLAYFGFNEELDLNYRGKLSDQVVMTVSCPKGELWRSMAFDNYNGHTWTMTEPKKTENRVSQGSLIYLSPVPSMPITALVPGTDLRQTFHMDLDQPNLVPAASIPTQIYFPTNRVELDSYGALRSPVLMEKSMEYTVISHVPRYDLKKLRQAPPAEAHRSSHASARLTNYLQLPDELPLSVRQLGLSTAGGGSGFARAERIQHFLLTNYEYDLNVPPTAENVDVVADFLLRTKRGYCEHFATAFVILCRAAGIPARLITGFHPGQYNPFTGLWEVRMYDAHAWAEIYLPRWGWIPFDPVPDGMPPAFQGAARESGASYAIERLLALLQAVSRTPAAQQCLKVLSQAFDIIGRWLSPALYLALFIWQPLVVGMAVVGLAFLLIRILGSGSQLVRFLKKAQAPPDPGDVGPSTREFLKVCRDLTSVNIERRPQDTAADLSARVHARAGLAMPGGDLPALVDDFLEEYLQARFGSGKLSGDLASLSGKIHERIQTRPHDKPS